MSPEKSKDKDKIELSDLDFDQKKVDIKNDNKSPLGIPSNLKLTADKFTEIENSIADYIDYATEDSSKAELTTRLAKAERMIRAEFDASKDKPWDTSSEVETTLVGTHCRVIANALSRTLATEPYFLAAGPVPTEAKFMLQNFMNTKARYELKYEEFITKLAKVATETPQAIINPEWVREVRYDCDYEVFQSVEGYKAKYPNSDEAGLTPEQYKREIEIVTQNIKDKGYHECVYEFPKLVRNEPVLNVIHPADFIMYPFNSLRIDLALLVGHMVHYTYNDLVTMERDGVLIKGTAKRIQETYVNAAEEDADEVQEEQEAGKGIETSHAVETYKTKIYTAYKGFISLDPYNEGRVRDYEFLMLIDEEVLCRIAKSRNHIGKRPYISAPIDPNTKSFWGNSIPERLENPHEAVSTMLRQLIDSNTIANVPTFKGNQQDRDWFERTYQSLKFKPGTIYWLRSAGQFEQFQIRSINASDYLRIIQYVVQDAEMASGASRTLAGQVLAEDPEAPGVKTAMLIQQSNFMVNQYIRNIMHPVEETMELVRALYRQNMNYEELYPIERQDHNGNVVVDEVRRDIIPLLETNVRLVVRPQKVDDNQQLRMQNDRQDLELLMAIPDVNQNPVAKQLMIRKILMNRESWTLDEINQVTTPIEEILATLQSAQGDLQQAQALGQQQQQLADGVEQTAQATEDIALQNVLGGQGGPPQQ